LGDGERRVGCDVNEGALSTRDDLDRRERQVDLLDSAGVREKLQ